MAPFSPQGRETNTSFPSKESGDSFLRLHLKWDMVLFSPTKMLPQELSVPFSLFLESRMTPHALCIELLSGCR